MSPDSNVSLLMSKSLPAIIANHKLGLSRQPGIERDGTGNFRTVILSKHFSQSLAN